MQIARRRACGFFAAGMLAIIAAAQDNGKKPTSYMPVAVPEDFESIMKRMSAARPQIMKRQLALLEESYDLGNRPKQGITMFRGKPVQEGVRARLRPGMTWEKLAQMTPEEVCRDQGDLSSRLHAPAASKPSRGRSGTKTMFHIRVPNRATRA